MNPANFPVFVAVAALSLIVGITIPGPRDPRRWMWILYRLAVAMLCDVALLSLAAVVGVLK